MEAILSNLLKKDSVNELPNKASTEEVHNKTESSTGYYECLDTRLTHPNNTSEVQLEHNEVVCEAIGCYAKATTTVAIRVGTKGSIFLNLCANCRPRFFVSSNSQQMEVLM